MTREEAIKELKYIRESFAVNEFSDEAMGMAIKALEQQWIPCSERLPENDDWVIVSIRDEFGDTPYEYTDSGWYLDKGKCWVVEAEERNDVIAWMPLPKPYKEDSK